MMLRVSTGLALVAAAVMPNSAVAQDPPQRRISRCLLEIDGRTYIRGPCNFSPLDRNGSFTITEPVGRPYFAYLLRDGAGAQGYWNEQRGADHAHTDLGAMRREGACWRNRRARICAWQ